MTTFEKLQAELKQAQDNIKIFKAVEVVVDAMNRPDDFVTTLFAGSSFEEERRLFKAGQKFWSCGSMSLKSFDTKRFNEIVKDEKGTVDQDFKALHKAVLTIEKASDESWSMIREAVEELS